MTDFVDRLPQDAVEQIFGYVDFRTKVKLERVAEHWRSAILETYAANMKEVWIYTIFRRGRNPDHEEMRVKLSYHGPVFWERQVIYIYLCTCHFQAHETSFKSLCSKLGSQVDRICIVDSPVNYPYVTDEFYRFILDTMPNLKWMYLRELDLEPISWSLVHVLANHQSLKKVIVHWCRNYSALADFEVLQSRLMVCNSQIKGLNYIDDIETQLRDMRIQDQKDKEDIANKKPTSTAAALSQLANGIPGEPQRGAQNLSHNEVLDVIEEIENGIENPDSECEDYPCQGGHQNSYAGTNATANIDNIGNGLIAEGELMSQPISSDTPLVLDNGTDR